MRPRRLSGVVVRSLNFTVKACRGASLTPRLVTRNAAGFRAASRMAGCGTCRGSSSDLAGADGRPRNGRNEDTHGARRHGLSQLTVVTLYSPSTRHPPISGWTDPPSGCGCSVLRIVRSR